ncbi:MAG: bifunctional oligoribonuclease/PAP phosphatase NrnA [Clostridiales bacterium]|nr:bifunctional oligoribonuclease/PAP phosphatase NrnA [Clostridiales bacterium]
MNWKELSPFLKPGQDIMVMTHERPDGDAWGSVLGFCLVLESLGYRAKFIHIGVKPAKMYSWLPGQHLIDRIEKESLNLPEDAVILVLDCGDLERCEFTLRPEQVVLNVDHHISNPSFGRINWVDPQAGATAQILCRVLFEAGIQLSPEAATCFYIALVTDTGSFRFSNSNGESLRHASILTDIGADLPLIRQYLWENRPRQELALLQEMMRSMVLFADGQGVLCELPYELVMATAIHDAETDTALEAVRSVDGVEAVVLLKEAEPDLIKVSLRSKAKLDSAAVMTSIGGGGHTRAAGATLQESLPAAREKVRRLLTEALKQ